MPSKKFQKFKESFPEINPIDSNQMLPGRIIGKTGVPILIEGYRFPAPEIPEGYQGGTVVVNGVPGTLLTKDGVRENTAMVHIHGGGFTEGSSVECMSFLKFLCDSVNVACYSIDYRLAPYNLFPACVDDCVAFVRGVRELGYEKIILGGQSAGACLSLSTTLSLKDAGETLPVAVWCSSPPVDIRYDLRDLYTHDIFTDLVENIQQTLAPDEPRENPLLSPIYGDYHGFPPLLIQTGGGESLAEGCVALAAKAAAANVEVTLHFAQDMPHCYADPNGTFPEAVDAANEVAIFYNNQLDLDDR